MFSAQGSGRKKKVKKHGRPPNSINVWTQKMVMVEQFFQSDSYTYMYINVLLNPQLNPHINLCKCKLYDKLFFLPLTLKSCQHSFCATCLNLHLSGKSINDGRCPTCKQLVSLGDIMRSIQIMEMIKCLIVEWSKCCRRHQIYEKHSCTHTIETNLSINSSNSSISLNSNISEIMTLTQDSEIPREIEDVSPLTPFIFSGRRC